MKKLAYSILLFPLPLAAGPLDVTIAKVEVAQKFVAQIPNVQKALEMGSAQSDALKVKLLAPKQQLAAAQTQLTQVKEQLKATQAQIATITTMPSSIRNPLNSSLAKQATLLEEFEAILHRAQASIGLVEKNLPDVKNQTATLAKDLGPVYTSSNELLAFVHNMLIGLQARHDHVTAKTKEWGAAVKNFFGR